MPHEIPSWVIEQGPQVPWYKHEADHLAGIAVEWDGSCWHCQAGI